jgi:hypothetical protein
MEGKAGKTCKALWLRATGIAATTSPLSQINLSRRQQWGVPRCEIQLFHGAGLAPGRAIESVSLKTAVELAAKEHKAHKENRIPDGSSGNKVTGSMVKVWTRKMGLDRGYRSN